jgi:hypothetical protein
MATDRTIHKERLDQQHHKEDTLRTHLRVHTGHPTTSQNHTSTEPRRTAQRNTETSLRSPGSHQHSTETPYQGNKLQTLQSRRSRVARTNKPPATIRVDQTRAKKIRTLPHHSENIRHNVPAQTTQTLEDPQHLPRQTPHALQTNGQIRAELPRTPTGTPGR